MRLAINLINFPDARIAGAGYNVRRLLALSERQLAGITTEVFVQQGVDPYGVFCLPRHPNVSTTTTPRFRSRFGRIVYEQTVLPRLLSGRCDVLYSPTPGNPVCLQRSVKSVVSVLDMIPFVDRGKFGLVQTLYVQTLTRLNSRRADRIITISQSSRRDIARYLPHADAKTRVVPCCVPWQPVEEAIFGSDLILVSTVERGKNVERALEAFGRYLRVSGDASTRLIVVGKAGRGYAALVRLKDSLGLGERVVFKGYLPEEELRELYRSCRALLYVSLYEGFGLPLLEAMCFGKPSVASNVSSLPEVLGRSGILVDPCSVEAIAAAIAQVVAAPERFTDGIPEMLEKYSPARAVEAFWDAISRWS